MLTFPGEQTLINSLIAGEIAEWHQKREAFEVEIGLWGDAEKALLELSTKNIKTTRGTKESLKMIAFEKIPRKVELIWTNIRGDFGVERTKDRDEIFASAFEQGLTTPPAEVVIPVMLGCLLPLRWGYFYRTAVQRGETSFKCEFDEVTETSFTFLNGSDFLLFAKKW